MTSVLHDRLLRTAPDLIARFGPQQNLERLQFDRAELAGAVADLGVLVPIAVALIVKNGLSATAVLVPAGLLYVMAGLFYRIPVPVQPLKAFGAIAIAYGLGSSEIAAGALLMGAVFVVLGASGFLDWVARIFPRPIIRGVQLSVGLLFCQLAWKLTTVPPPAFIDHVHSTAWLAGGGAVVAVAALLLRRHNVSLVLIVLAIIGMVLSYHGAAGLGTLIGGVPDAESARIHDGSSCARLTAITADLRQLLPRDGRCRKDLLRRCEWAGHCGPAGTESRHC